MKYRQIYLAPPVVFASRLRQDTIPTRRPQSGIDTIVLLAIACVSLGVVMVGGQAEHLNKKYVDTVGVDAQLPALTQAGAASRCNTIATLRVVLKVSRSVATRVNIVLQKSAAGVPNSVAGGKAQSRTLTDIPTKYVNVACNIHTGRRTLYQTRRLRRPSVRGPSTPALSLSHQN